jgi:predicted RNA-binding Zn ribbon-like protein
MTTFQRIGGDLCLDFVNTTSWTPQGPDSEKLRKPEDLLAWGREAGLLQEPAHPPRQTPRDVEAHERTLRSARRLRQMLHDVLAPLAHGDVPAVTALAAFNRALARALPHLRVRARDGAFHWEWAHDPSDPRRILAAVVWAAGCLLTSPEVERVKACPAKRCGWLFVDRSRRHNRRWCQMGECGSRDKARRYYHRHRGGEHPAA